MRPTEMLKQEHRLIENALLCLEKLCQDATLAGRLDMRSASDVMDFFRGFADRCHHAKEEDLLFPLLERKGFDGQAGPTAVMRAEHASGRHHVEAMEGTLRAASAGSAPAVAAFRSQARAHAAMLREHIEKEDTCLFRMRTPRSRARTTPSWRWVSKRSSRVRWVPTPATAS